ncbi:hypothetical protein VNO78_05924 [Psophocarpus tetragonolobus]|uniref:Uncharacterized protein n=1 Tax=Psophocarpus tetragonolobus TaxID=3891 RepID=A0AAN9XRU3_PSOTE
MAHQVVFHPQPSHRHRHRGVGEMAGGAAADCAAVCCCVPCTVINLLVLAVYKVPKGLVKKAAHKRRRRLPKTNVVGDHRNDIVLLYPQTSSSIDVTEFVVGSTRLEEFLKKQTENENENENEGLEKEMWARFAGTGFWRSESQRQP